MSPIRLISPISVAARLGALALGVSAIPLVANAAEPADGQWIYGVAARESEEATAAKANFVDYGGLGIGQNGGIKILVAGATGAGVVVAIVDTGIDLDHPEFTGRIAAGGTCFGDPATTCSGAAAFGADDNGHGTHVAGIVAAANDGVGKT